MDKDAVIMAACIQAAATMCASSKFAAPPNPKDFPKIIAQFAAS